MKQSDLRWIRLDNAAKLYPAAKRRNWLHSFRLSATLTDPVDVALLQSAFDVTVHRFPSIAARLRRGLFWYYLEEVPKAPKVTLDEAYPFANLRFSDIKRCCVRVLYYENRIAIQVFHVVTDGNGALVFLKTLLAEYIRLKYHTTIPTSYGILDCKEQPTAEELEDSYLKYGGKVEYHPKQQNAYIPTGTKESDGYLNVITGIIPLNQLLPIVKSYKVSLTVFLAAVLTDSLIELQAQSQPNRLHRKPVKVLIPVNLRNHFKSSTLRNFVLYITPSIDPSLGEYRFDEIVQQVYHQLGTQLTDKHLNARFSGNVNAEKFKIVKVMPLFLKNWALRLVYNATGERKSSISISNLGAVKIPDKMEPYISRFDFILGVQATKPNNCSIISYQNHLYVNFIRNIKETELERVFFTKLRKLGVPIKIESNHKAEE